ncbi:hypothetical protein EDB85DRAFT_2296129 [Lactarius pseudohatsudake]|nr:hypothetical protein EDB85DRAFT_2296129 [Lactarius pseudohatsudake]
MSLCLFLAGLVVLMLNVHFTILKAVVSGFGICAVSRYLVTGTLVMSFLLCSELFETITGIEEQLKTLAWNNLRKMMVASPNKFDTSEEDNELRLDRSFGGIP